MKIISWNVNGLRSACEKGFLDWISQENADIGCMGRDRGRFSFKNIITLFCTKAIIYVIIYSQKEFRAQISKDTKNKIRLIEKIQKCKTPID